MKTAGRRGGKRGVTIAIETHDDWRSPKNLLALLNRIGAKKASPWCTTSSIASSPAIRGRIRIARSAAHPVLSRQRRLSRPGREVALHRVRRGDLPYREILKKLKKDGFKNYLSFEWRRSGTRIGGAGTRLPHFVHKMKAEWKDA